MASTTTRQNVIDRMARLNRDGFQVTLDARKREPWYLKAVAAAARRAGRYAGAARIAALRKTFELTAAALNAETDAALAHFGAASLYGDDEPHAVKAYHDLERLDRLVAGATADALPAVLAATPRGREVLALEDDQARADDAVAFNVVPARVRDLVRATHAPVAHTLPPALRRTMGL